MTAKFYLRHAELSFKQVSLTAHMLQPGLEFIYLPLHGGDGCQVKLRRNNSNDVTITWKSLKQIL